MTRTCTICSHPERAAIDQAISAGTSYRNIAQQFGVGYTAVARHASEHIAQAVASSQAAKREGAALDVIAQLKAINDAALAVLKDARKAGDGELTLKAIDRLQRQIELQAKLLGDLSDAPAVSIILTPEWVSVQTAILAALTPYAEARIAVAAALARLDSAQDTQSAQGERWAG